MSRSRESDPITPLPVAHFRALIDGEEIGLQAVSALHGRVDPKSSDEPQQCVTLTRAATADQRLFDWYRAATQGDKRAERELTIVQLDSADGEVVNAWRLRDAVPVRWSGPAFDALDSAVALEQLEVRYAAIERDDRA